MLRITPSTSPAQAKRYYTTADYFLSDHERPGTWHGQGAERLGLEGTVTKSEWELLCDNRNPSTGERLTPRNQKDRRVGYDFTFNAPKSVSLLYAFTQDERIVEAFRQSVNETMREIEAEIKTRVRAKGADSDRTTGEAIWGEFIHFTGRPEQGVPDPHLHAHCFVFNQTWDAEEHRWKAAQFGDLKRDAPYFEAVFHTRLAERLQRIGLPVKRTKKGYELAGFEPSTMRKFSRRTARIEALAKAKGITDPKEKAELGAKTRNRKAANLKFGQLAETWRSWLTPAESGNALVAAHRLESGIDVFHDERVAAKEAVNASLSHHFERASVVPERVVLAYALKRAAGKASVGTILDEFKRTESSGGVIWGERDGRRVVTTREVLQEEMAMIAFARKGRGTCAPLGAAKPPKTDAELSASQQRAVERLLTSHDRVMLLRGAAGAGKTRLMKEVIRGIEANGKKVFTVAPSAEAGRGVLREEVTPTANTVAHLLTNQVLQAKLKHQVIWVDEAGLVGTKTLRAVFDVADRIDARVILSGDTRQHGSVERGAAMRLLETEAGLIPAELSEIRRQSGRYREAVQALADGHTKQGFETLQSLGWVHALPADERYQRLASDYVKALTTLKPNQKALIISPTHREGEAVTHAVREALKKAGRLGTKERTFTQLRRTDLTEAQRSDPLEYHAGDVIVFTQNAKGHTRGERLVVGEQGRVEQGGQGAPFDQAQEKYQVYRAGTITLAPGDAIRITAGGTTLDGHRLNTGSIHTVKGFTPEGDIRLANGWTIGREFGHLSHGWVSTSHGSQGKTVERVFVAQSAESIRASSAEQWYVSVSRGKTRADIYCEDAHELLAAIQQSHERLSATEFVAQKTVRERTKAIQRMNAVPVHATKTITPRRERGQERAIP